MYIRSSDALFQLAIIPLKQRRLTLRRRRTSTGKALGPRGGVVHHPPCGPSVFPASAPQLKRQASQTKMPKVSEEMHAYYAARAPYYDAIYLKPERRADIALLTSHLQSTFADLEVLEVACGTGYWTQRVAATARRVVATDATAEPLEFARIRPGNNEVRFELADAYALPVSLGMFNAAFAGLWFSHVPIRRRNQFFSSLHRRLRPGA